MKLRTTLLLFAILTAPAGKVIAGNSAFRALIVTGQCKHYHKWQESSVLLARSLEKTGLFQVETAVTPDTGQDMSSFQPDFYAYHVVVIDYEGDNWTEKTTAAFTDYVKAGGGVVCVHTGFAAINGSKEFDRIVGLRSRNYKETFAEPRLYWQDGKIVRDTQPGKAGFHPPSHEFVITVRNQNHPITRGLPTQWKHGPDDLYASLRGPAEDVTVLATAFSDPSFGAPTTSHHEPMLFTVGYGRGRIFVTTLGHVGKGGKEHPFIKRAMENVGFIVTFQRGAEWAATGKVTQAVPPDFPTPDKVSLRQTSYPSGDG